MALEACNPTFETSTDVAVALNTPLGKTLEAEDEDTFPFVLEEEFVNAVDGVEEEFEAVNEEDDDSKLDDVLVVTLVDASVDVLVAIALEELLLLVVVLGVLKPVFAR